MIMIYFIIGGVAITALVIGVIVVIRMGMNQPDARTFIVDVIKALRGGK